MSRIHRLASPVSLVVSMLALTVSLSAGATYAATTLIGTNQIKDGAVTSAKIKDKTIATVDLSQATVNALKGARGPQGAAGVSGAIIRTVPAAVSLNPVGGQNMTVLQADNIPAGKYAFIYRADVVSFETADPGHAYYRCSVQAPTTQVGAATTYAHAANPPTIVNQMTVADTLTLTGPTTVRVQCSHDNTTTGKPYVENQKLILIKVGAIDRATANPAA